MKKLLALSLVTVLGLWLGTRSAAQDAPAAPQLETVLQKGSYSVGYRIGGNVGQSFADVDVALLCRGIADALEEREPALDEKAMFEALNAFQAQAEKAMREKAARAAEENKKKGDEFLAANAKEEGVVVTASGLQYKILTPGTGASPKPSDTVKVHYHGTLLNGKVFDSSVKRGEPIEFPVTGVIKGWVEALQLMKVGAKWKLFIPSDLAYGPNPRPGPIGPNDTLIFEVELLGIK